MIQLSAVAFVIAFYQMDFVRTAVAGVHELQLRGSFWFAAAGNVLSGVLIPELVKTKFRAAIDKPISLGDFVFRCVMMALVGIIVYYFYLFQDHLFGNGIDPLTLFKKVLFDQLAFSLFVSVPFVIGMFILHENRYNFVDTLKLMSPKTFRARVVPLWATGLAFWPFALIGIYAMPADLQYVMFLFANAAYCLVMMLVASNRTLEEA